MPSKFSPLKKTKKHKVRSEWDTTRHRLKGKGLTREEMKSYYHHQSKRKEILNKALDRKKKSKSCSKH
jgi:hypothetical protein